MVWKDVKNTTDSKKAITVKTKSLFYYAHTRSGTELNQQANCKTTSNKKLTKKQEEEYNQILEEERIKNEPRHFKVKKNNRRF